MKYTPPVKSFAHQRKGLVWLWQKTQGEMVGNKGGAFFWDPGTGKTKAGYDYTSALFIHRGVHRVLVLCPINALQVWDIQADTHIHDSITFTIAIPTGSIADKAKQVRSIDPGVSELYVLVMNYASIIKRDKRWEIMAALEAFDPDVVIVDESHHIKGATTKQAKAAHAICGRAEYVLLLTGTPIGKNYLDLYSQLKAIDPRIWEAGWTKTGNMSWTNFRTNYATFGGRSGYEILGYINVEDLEDRYEPQIRSVRKEQISDMPKVTDTIIPVELDANARRVYKVFAKDGLVVHKRHLIEAPIPLTKLLRLQQMTGGWVHDEQGEIVEVQRNKLAIFTDLLEDLASAGKSVVVFARFLAEMDAIYEAALRAYKPHVYQIRGGVTANNRRKFVSSFQTHAGCMVIQIAAAEALDGLQTNCSYGIFYSTDYSLIHWNQARGRLDRVGQKEPVTFYHLQVRSSVDSLIREALEGKKDIERLVMDNPQVLLRPDQAYYTKVLLGMDE